MTGTTYDDIEHDLWDLVDGCTLHSEMPMACGHEADLSLDTGEWVSHCRECPTGDDDDDDDDDEG